MDSKFYKIQPSCPGMLGAESVGALTNSHVEKLHFIFLYDYLEPIVCAQNQYLVTPELQQRVMALEPAPHSVLFTRENLVVRTDGYQFDILWPNSVPKVNDYVWMKILGIARQDDFGIAAHRLVISERVWNCIKDLPFQYAIVEEYSIDRDDS